MKFCLNVLLCLTVAAHSSDYSEHVITWDGGIDYLLFLQWQSLPPSLALFSPAHPDTILYSGYGNEMTVQFYSLTQKMVTQRCFQTYQCLTISLSVCFTCSVYEQLQFVDMVHVSLVSSNTWKYSYVVNCKALVSVPALQSMIVCAGSFTWSCQWVALPPEWEKEQGRWASLVGYNDSLPSSSPVTLTLLSWLTANHSWIGS